MRNDYVISKIPKKVAPTSTDYVPIPDLTPEEREKSNISLKKEIKKLVNKHPAMFPGKRWDEYREPKQEENENETTNR